MYIVYICQSLQIAFIYYFFLILQPPKTILAQCLVRPNVPVHTISFNCADREANEFLCQLAKDTGGRFHYYSENGVDPDGPEPWEVNLYIHDIM